MKHSVCINCGKHESNCSCDYMENGDEWLNKLWEEEDYLDLKFIVVEINTNYDLPTNMLGSYFVI